MVRKERFTNFSNTPILTGRRAARASRRAPVLPFLLFSLSQTIGKLMKLMKTARKGPEIGAFFVHQLMQSW